jgi:hypothetical protein
MGRFLSVCPASQVAVILSDKLFFETRVQEPLSNRRLLCFKFRRHGNVSVERCERKIVELAGERVRAVQAMRPPSDEDDLSKSRRKSIEVPSAIRNRV